MKRYVNCFSYGSFPSYDSAEDARKYALDAYAVAVEIELPDPPRQWKVGDWFIPAPPFTWNSATLICDMTADGRWSGITRWENDDPRGVDGWTVTHLIEGAIPCDPPDWFTQDGAS